MYKCDICETPTNGGLNLCSKCEPKYQVWRKKQLNAFNYYADFVVKERKKLKCQKS